MALTAAELAYAAGFMDGEGCIRAQRNNRGPHTLRVSWGQKDVRPLLWLRDRFGGSYDNHPEKRPVSHLYLSGEAACSFLEAVLPYLIVKRAQAEYAIRIFRTGRFTDEHSLELTRMKKELV